MNAQRLAGTGVLVTRPESQSAGISAEIRAAGGNVVPLPVLRIVPRSETAIAADVAKMPVPDIAIFVSRNAAACGLFAILPTGAAIAAIGPATKEAIEQAGSRVAIFPGRRFDSEALLEHPDLQAVAGRNIHIVRGNAGRELLGSALRERGAIVSHLATYERVPAKPDPADLERLARTWRRGGIDYVIAMSVESLTSLLEILPADCRSMLRKSPLVTPSKRVIQTALKLLPEVRTLLAEGPQAADMVNAIVKSRNEKMES